MPTAARRIARSSAPATVPTIEVPCGVATSSGNTSSTSPVRLLTPIDDGMLMPETENTHDVMMRLETRVCACRPATSCWKRNPRWSPSKAWSASVRKPAPVHRHRARRERCRRAHTQRIHSPSRPSATWGKSFGKKQPNSAFPPSAPYRTARPGTARAADTGPGQPGKPSGVPVPELRSLPPRRLHCRRHRPPPGQRPALRMAVRPYS